MSTEADDDGRRHEVLVAVLLALVALTAALAAWRTTVVGSNAGDANREGLLQTVQVQAFRDLDQAAAYQEAGYALRALAEEAAADAMVDSDVQSLRTLGRNVRQYTLPNIQQFAGTFIDDNLVTPAGPLDVEARIAQLEAANESYATVDPEAAFAEGTNYSDEKQWLTVVSVILAVALFWLGLAEISAGRWRLYNLLIGITVWAIGLGGFVAVELFAISTRGGAL